MLPSKVRFMVALGAMPTYAASKIFKPENVTLWVPLSTEIIAAWTVPVKVCPGQPPSSAVNIFLRV